MDNKSKQMKKYCNIQKLEIDFVKVTDINKNLEVEKTNLLNQMSMQLDQKYKEHQEAMIKLQDENQQQINEISAQLQQKEEENLQFKKLLEYKTEEIINLKKQNEEDKLKITNLENKKNTEIIEINKRLNQKDSELQIIQRQLDYFNQVYSKQYQSQIQQFSKTLIFSNTYKHSNCQVSEGGKVVESNGSYLSCLCDQAIPKTGKIQFAFQIINIGCCFVGIGYRDFLQKNNYQSYGNGGQYSISSDRYTCSHHNKQIDGRPSQSTFSFTINDIIIVEVSIEMKYIKWRKYSNSQEMAQLELDTSISQELYPCVCLYNSKVKILDNILI
ncbi:unnamed protein product [Paramecium primaurelia]|uniref:Uncharacterized protein n=1 Tax=Paramecium primaurelia TaxID=5886 RepID=A0A8S1QN38_PARPR|nr:unnamed protein product [Paramecium primaurelia]